MKRRTKLLTALLLTMAAPAAAQGIEQFGVADLAGAMADGRLTSEAAVRTYLARIDAMNRQGPRLNAVIAVNPDAIAEARTLDAERRAGKLRGPLHGVPLLVKDNVDVVGMPNTAGSLALAANLPARDAPVIAALKAQGALILGKTNLSEWANFRSNRSMSGWSAVGGLTRNPYALDRTTCGSSSGSGAGVAAGFAPGAVGTETDGSIICPSSMTGLVGLKPTMGAVPRTGIVPISHSQDIAGPMARSVRDVALLFSAMIASDPADPVTREADAHKRDYAAALDPAVIKGMRIGYVARGGQPEWKARFAAALDVLRAAGAILIEVDQPKSKAMGDAEGDVLHCEFKTDLAAYLATTDPAKVPTRTLADLIAFNDAHKDAELGLFDQDIFTKAEQTAGGDSAACRKARATSLRLAGRQGLEHMLESSNVALIVMPSYGPAWPSDVVWGDQYEGPGGSTSMAAIGGFPHLTVPMGLAGSLPVGISFLGPRWSEQRLLDVGYAYEQAAAIRITPSFAKTADAGPLLEGAR